MTDVQLQIDWWRTCNLPCTNGRVGATCPLQRQVARPTFSDIRYRLLGCSWPNKKTTRKSWIHEFTNSWIHEFKNSRVHEFMNSWIHGVMDSWIHELMNPWMHESMNSWIHGFMNPWIHEFVKPWIHELMNSWIHGFNELPMEGGKLHRFVQSSVISGGATCHRRQASCTDSSKEIMGDQKQS